MARVRRYQSDYLKNMDIHHVGIEVANIEESLHPFRDVLGFDIIEQFQYEDEQIVFLKKDHSQIELVQSLKHPNEHPEFHIAFLVNDIEIPRTLFKNSEGWEGPVTYPNGWTSEFMKLGNQLYIEWLMVSF